MADKSSSVNAMRDMAESSHGCNSCSAVVLRRQKLRARVPSYAAAGIASLEPIVQALAPAFTLPSFRTHCHLLLRARESATGQVGQRFLVGMGSGRKRLNILG